MRPSTRPRSARRRSSPWHWRSRRCSCATWTARRCHRGAPSCSRSCATASAARTAALQHSASLGTWSTFKVRGLWRAFRPTRCTLLRTSPPSPGSSRAAATAAARASPSPAGCWRRSAQRRKTAIRPPLWAMTHATATRSRARSAPPSSICRRGPRRGRGASSRATVGFCRTRRTRRHRRYFGRSAHFFETTGRGSYSAATATSPMRAGHTTRRRWARRRWARFQRARSGGCSR
mmetsp:Transcript_13306/g.44466  ORF Transcript_13306/g.44466 Transcript_13306/m.44466 type:complete len:234 (+) Transcript_13306:2390-3091(+)